MITEQSKRTANIQEGKSRFARLLAQENLFVEHSHSAQTASFDVNSRILTLPVWKDLKDCEYNLLCSHEVGHARWTPKWDLELGKKISRAKAEIGLRFLNIVEDIRIERMIQQKFPGLKRDYRDGYKEIEGRNLFGTHGMNISECLLVDRVNLKYKIGHVVKVPFSEEEHKFLYKLDHDLITFDDAIRLAKELFDKSKDELDKLMQQPNQMVVSSDGEKGDGNSSQAGGSKVETERSSEEKTSGEDNEENQDGSSSEENGAEEGNSSGGSDSGSEEKEGSKASDSSDNGDGDKEKNKESEKGSENGEGTGQSKSKDNDNDAQDANSGVAGGAGTSSSEMKGTDNVPDSKTQRNFEYNLRKMIDKTAKPRLYLNIPEFNGDNCVLHWKEVCRKLVRNYKKNPAAWELLQRKYNNWYSRQRKIINHMVAEFERKKKAHEYANAAHHETGEIDIDRLHEYQTEEDIFLTSTAVPTGKNHGSLIFIDWSGSMSQSITGTIEQLLTLAIFKRRVGSHFRAFSFGAGRSGLSTSQQCIDSRMVQFNLRENDLYYPDNFVLQELLSSSMKVQEFNEACMAVFALGLSFDYTFMYELNRMPAKRRHELSRTFQTPRDHSLGGTPLLETMCAAMSIGEKFKNKNRIEILNMIFLTDDGGWGGNTYIEKIQTSDINSKRYLKLNRFDHMKQHVIVRDLKTREEYDLGSRVQKYGTASSEEEMRILIEAVQNRLKANAVNFFIGGGDPDLVKAKRASHSRNTAAIIHRYIPDLMPVQYGYKSDLTSHARMQTLLDEYAKNRFVALQDPEAGGYREVYVIPVGSSLRLSEPKDSSTEDIAKAAIKKSHSIKAKRVLVNRFIDMIS